MDNSINLTEAREYLTNLIPQAGEILQKYFTSGNFTQKSKGGVDFLTQADEEADKFLRDAIQKKYPHSAFLTEETAPKDYSSFKEESNLWIIDPLDGTINFSRKHPNFAISVALVNKGVSELGFVYLPITQDLYYAQKDQEYAYLNGKEIHVSSTNELGEAVIGCDWAWEVEKRLNIVHWLGNVSTHVRQIKSMGSAVSDLASLANGRIDGYLISGLKPWDVAASSLLIEKAGGKITTPQDKDWDVFQPDLLASNALLHDKILDLIKEK